MFYKSREHYKNTLIMSVRENFDTDIQFVSGAGEKFLQIMYMTSDRCEDATLGYDLLMWVRYNCEDKEQLLKVLKNCVITIELDEDNIFEEIETIFSFFDVLPKTERL